MRKKSLNVPSNKNDLNHVDNLCAVTFASNNLYKCDVTNPRNSIDSLKSCTNNPANVNLYSKSKQGQNISHVPKATWNLFSDFRAQEMPMKSSMFSNSATRPKAAKYKFPAVDPPEMTGLRKYSPKELYIFVINLMYHRLTPNTYKLWCELAERDVSFPEMSKNGVLETSYSLKKQRDKFKQNKKRTSIISESNLLMSNDKNPHTLPNDI